MLHITEERVRRSRMATPDFMGVTPMVNYSALYELLPEELLALASSTYRKPVFGVAPYHTYLHAKGSLINPLPPLEEQPPYGGFSGTTMGILPEDLSLFLLQEQHKDREQVAEIGPEGFFNEKASLFERYHYELLTRAVGLREVNVANYCSELATGGTEAWYVARKWGWGRVLRDEMRGMITILPVNSASKAAEAGYGRSTTTRNFLGQTLPEGKLLEGIGYIPNRPDLISETFLLSYDSDGEVLPVDYYDTQIEQIIEYAAAHNVLVSLTVTPGNKRGLGNVSLELAKRLHAQYPRNVMIVIDDCQGRSDIDRQDLIDNHQAVVMTSFGKSQGIGLGAIVAGNASYFGANRAYFNAVGTLSEDVLFYTPSLCYYCPGVSGYNDLLLDPRLRVVDPTMELRIKAYLYLQEQLNQFQLPVRKYISNRITHLMKTIITQSSGYLKLIEYRDQVIHDIINVAVQVEDVQGRKEMLSGTDLSLFHYALGTDCTPFIPKSGAPDELHMRAFWGQPETTLDRFAVLRPDHNAAQLVHILNIIRLVNDDIKWEQVQGITPHTLEAATIDFAIAHFLVQSFQPSIHKANFIARNWSTLKHTLQEHMPPKSAKNEYDWRSLNAQAAARLGEQVDVVLDVPGLTS